MFNLSEKQMITIEASRRYLDSFAIAVDPDYQVNWHHEIICRKLEDALDKAIRGEKSRIIIELPPRHGKSDLATKKFPAFALGKYPDIPVLVTSYSSDLASDFGLGTRDLMNEDNYQAIFSTRLRQDQKAKSKWLTDKKGGYTAAGVGGGITGKGFKIGVIDDPIKNREEAESDVYQEKIWKWYLSTFYTRQTRGYGAIIIIMTRWHKRDLVGRLLEKEEKDIAAGIPDSEIDHWEVIRFPAIAEEKEEFRNVGDPIWPEMYPKPMLLNIKNTIGLYEWSALYQQTPISSETQEFKEDWFPTYRPEELNSIQGLLYYTLIDLAHTTKKKSHNTVIRTIAKAPTLPQWYLIDEVAGHLDPLQTIDAMFDQWRKYRSKFWLEGVGYQRVLKTFVEEEMRKRQEFFEINLLKKNSEVSKEERIRGLIPIHKTKIVKYRESGEDEPLKRELLDFPQGELDDRADCLANGLEAVLPTQYKPRTPSRRRSMPESSIIGG